VLNDEAGAAAAEGFAAADEGCSFLSHAKSELWDATASGLSFAARGLSAEGFGFAVYGDVANP
jgi:hypothetical protein